MRSDLLDFEAAPIRFLNESGQSNISFTQSQTLANSIGRPIWTELPNANAI